MTILKTLFAATFAASLAAGGCVQQEEAPAAIAAAIPTNDQVAIKLPTAASTDRIAGEIAPWYVSTRDVTNTFNTGSAWVLVLVHQIVQYPVTSVSGDTYTWGPWSNALDPASYKLDVTAVGDGTYDYTLSGMSKTVSGSSFVAIITGHADPRPGDALGNGTFTLDFDAAKQVDPIDNANNSGQIDATYDLAAKHLGLTITTTDATGAPVDATYAYDETASGGGDMTLEIIGDGSTTKTGENATLRSRWLATGAGRADGRVTGGDIGATVVTESQCWDTMFDLSYYVDSVNFAPTSGDPTTCAFADVDLPPM